MGVIRIVVSNAQTSAPRAVCYRCRKPKSTCVCGFIGTAVANRTPILVLQHPGERKHPLGTARFAELGLQRVQVVVARGHGPRGLTCSFSAPPGCALLYPWSDAQPLEEIPAAERPRSLLVLDGTWSTAAKLFRDNAWMRTLPRLRLTPATPSCYRIRREPRAHCLSTIESIVAALRILEPETAGLDGLLGALSRMVEAQIERASHKQRRQRLRRRTSRSAPCIPPALLAAGERAVLVTTESASRRTAAGTKQRSLVCCVALRPSDGSRFEAYLRQELPVSAAHLHHLAVAAEHLAAGVSLSEFACQWHQFAGPSPLLISWNQANLTRLREAADTDAEGIVLKSVYGNLQGRSAGGVVEAMSSLGLTPKAPLFVGRVGQRLAALHALYHAIERGVPEIQPRLGNASAPTTASEQGEL